MPDLKRTLVFAAPVAGVVALIAVFAGSVKADVAGADEAFPRGLKILYPDPSGEVVATGNTSDEFYPQPINYSHMLHAGQLEIQCEYCHTYARRSIHAGVPATEVCMNCHAQIETEDRPELVKLKQYYDAAEPIPWNKVHDLPDFVYFSHKRHVRAGVDCAECHGDMKLLRTARRQNTLRMGWCLDCHRNHPSVDTNYGASAELRRAELKDCWTCHK